VPLASRDLKDLFIVIGLNQVFDKTVIKFYIEIVPSTGKILQSLAYHLGTELAKSFCNFKTFVKQ
jgi:hypothetical protein